MLVLSHPILHNIILATRVFVVSEIPHGGKIVAFRLQYNNNSNNNNYNNDRCKLIKLVKHYIHFHIHILIHILNKLRCGR